MRVGYRGPVFGAGSFARPDLRRPPRANPGIYRVRVDLDHSSPPIWRRLDLRSDLPLDVVHQVLQVAFNWDDYHLHRFSLGGGPFDQHSQLFLCPYDAANPEFEDDDGLPASQVRLDETLQDPGEQLRYLYDYGDTWELTLQLEQVLTGLDDSATAVLVDGRRAAPPEDCGGLTDADDLAQVLDDPARFEPDEINKALRGPFFVMREAGVDGRLVDLVHRLESTPIGVGFAARLARLVSEPVEVEAAETSLQAHRWFLDRASDGGIPLTSAGYLKPADVVAASEIVPAMGDWIGTNNREVHCAPLLDFRQSLQSLGLLRKYKGALLLTRAGAAARRDATTLWHHLAERLLPAAGDTFEGQAGLLLLAYAGSNEDAELPLDEIAAALTELGWRHQDGVPVQGYDLYRMPAYGALINVSDRLRTWAQRHRISPAASALARAALRRRT
jgi:Plasmid pRiA4b ORF-3-like protein